MNKQLLFPIYITLLAFLCPTPSLASSPPHDIHKIETNTLVMGYKDGSKPPYIGAIGDNSGAYQDLFTRAADAIGYKLKIVRLPKKRVYQHLELGQIDFYPSSGYSSKRAKYLYWHSNGLQSKQALLSQSDQEEISDFKEAQGTLLAPLGSSAAEHAKKAPGIKIQKMGKLPIDKAVLALQLGRGDFYIYDIDIFDYYLKRKQLKNYQQISLKLHENAIEKKYSSLHSAFSRHSKHFDAMTNPDFANTRSASSIAYRFEQALLDLQTSGVTRKIYQKYFK